jgi:hypothetical protein
MSRETWRVDVTTTVTTSKMVSSSLQEWCLKCMLHLTVGRGERWGGEGGRACHVVLFSCMLLCFYRKGSAVKGAIPLKKCPVACRIGIRWVWNEFVTLSGYIEQSGGGKGQGRRSVCVCVCGEGGCWEVLLYCFLAFFFVSMDEIRSKRYESPCPYRTFSSEPLGDLFGGQDRPELIASSSRWLQAAAGSDTSPLSHQSPCKSATWAVHKCVLWLLSKKSQLKVCRLGPSLSHDAPWLRCLSDCDWIRPFVVL